MNRHYWGDDAPTKSATVEYVEKKLLKSAMQIAICRVEHEPAGLASFAILHPSADLSGSLYLKDIFVVDKHRSTGVGERIMIFLAKIGVQENCVRFEWTVEGANVEAVKFYKRLGAKHLDEKDFYRMDRHALERLADSCA